MGYDPTGTVWWLVGAIVGAIIGFVATVIEDFADDGKVFNGSVSAREYVLQTAIGAIGGEAFGAASSVASSLAPVAVAEEAVAVANVAVEVVEATGAVGIITLISYFAKGYGPRSGHNQYENKMFKDAMKELDITNLDRQSRIHIKLHKYPYCSTYQELIETIKEILLKFGI